jgi:hypothetical protein
MAVIPKQRLPKSQKTEQWGIDTMKAILQISSFSRQEKLEIEKLYRAYAGELEEADYNYVLNPFNSQDQKLRRFPARLRNYNIIAPLVNLLMGEKAKRPVNFQVVALNPDAIDVEKEYVFDLMMENLQNALTNSLIERGVVQDEVEQPVDTPEQFEEKLQGYRDARAEAGHNLLEYLYHYLDIKDQNQKAFLDWLVAGEVYSYKGVSFNDVEREIIGPMDIDFSLGQNLEFIEDADWQCRRARMSVNQVVDAFHDLLTPEQIDSLEIPGTGASGPDFFLPFLNTAESGEEREDRHIDVMHVWWKSFKKVGVLTKVIDGQEIELEIDETYKLEAGDRVDWSWISEGWEGYQLNGRIYIGVGPAQYQRRSLTNPSKIKAPYNGRRARARYTKHYSVVAHAMIYQILYNIYHYRLELTVAKNKGKIALMEYNAIPKKAGWNEDKFIYYAEAMNFAFIDSTAEGDNGQKVNFNQYQVLDLSLGQYINSQMELLFSIKQELEDSLGINRQRKGNLQASDAVGTTERSVFQSATISEEIFRMFEKWEEKEYQGLLDIGKLAYANGKKATYVGLEQSIQTLAIEPGYLQEADLGVFATISSDEKQRLETLRGLTLEFTQNGVSPAAIAEVIEAKSFAKVKKLLTKAEKAKQNYEREMKKLESEQMAAMQESQAAAQKEMLDYQAGEKQLDRDHETDLLELELAAKGLLEELSVSAKREDIAAKSDTQSKAIEQQREAARLQYEAKLKDIAVKAQKATTSVNKK